MAAGWGDERLRGLPGVVDCTASDHGVVLVIDPDADARLLKARAQALLAESGDGRPLVVVVGSAATASPAGEPVAASAGSLAAFAIAVLLLLAVMPTAPRSDSGERRPAPADTAAMPISYTAALTPELVRSIRSYAPRPAAAPASSPASEPAPSPAAVEPPPVAPKKPSPDPRRPAAHGRSRAEARPTPAPSSPVTQVPPQVSSISIERSCAKGRGNKGC